MPTKGTATTTRATTTTGITTTTTTTGITDEGHGEEAARAGEPARRAVPSDLVRAEETVVHAVHLGGVITR